MTLEILKTVTAAGVDIDIYKGPIGISLSGGADSAILLYHLMKHKTDDKIHIFTTATMTRDLKMLDITVQIIKKLITITGNINIEHHISFIENVETRKDIFHKLKLYTDYDIIKLVYTGVTALPPVEVTDTFHTRSESDVIEERASRNSETLYRSGVGYTVYSPFKNVDKKTIAEIYENENLVDELFSLTRSCEWTPAYIQPDPGIGHCGFCWWCQEREWAFGRLN